MSSPDAIMRIGIRADASASIGTGHVRRTRAIADELRKRGHIVVYLVNGEALDVIPELPSSGFDIVLVEDDKTTADQLGSWPDGPLDLLLFDHYGLDASTHRLYRTVARKLAVLDDLADRPLDADLLIDMNFGRQVEDYAALVPEHCIMCIGQDYQIVRERFQPFRERTVPRTYSGADTLRILLCIGGADPRGLTLGVVRQLACSGLTLDLDIIMGASNPQAEAIRKIASEIPGKAEVNQTVDDMERRMAEANFAIGSAGTMTWERNYMALPSILLVVADNQSLVGHAMEAAGAAIVFDARASLPDAVITTAIREIAVDPARLQRMSDIAEGLASRDGVAAIANAIEAVARETAMARDVS